MDMVDIFMLRTFLPQFGLILIQIFSIFCSVIFNSYCSCGQGSDNICGEIPLEETRVGSQCQGQNAQSSIPRNHRNFFPSKKSSQNTLLRLLLTANSVARGRFDDIIFFFKATANLRYYFNFRGNWLFWITFLIKFKEYKLQVIVGEDFAFDITFEVNFIWHAFCIYSNLPGKLVICGGKVFPFLKEGHLLLCYYGSMGILVFKCGSQLIREVSYKVQAISSFIFYNIK